MKKTDELGVRENSGKRKWSLVDWESMEEMVAVLEFGANKYTNYIFFDTFVIGKIINDKIWEILKESKNVLHAETLSVSLQKGCVENVTTIIQNQNQVVLDVENIGLFLQEDFVNLVMKNSASKIDQKKLVGGMSINKIIETKKKTKLKNVLGVKKDTQIQNTSLVEKEANLLIDYLNTESLRNFTKKLVIKDVKYVEVKNDYILIMTIKLENLEVSFVVDAIKELDCYRKILTLLKTLFNISLKINDICDIKSGEWNWQKGLKTTEICESLLRHTFAYLNGEDNDKESGISHIGHIQCNAMFLAYMHKHRKDLDTRHKKNEQKTL
jgi:hypothetical protein